MPAVTIHYPRNFFRSDEKKEFKYAVRSIVATYMDAVDPETGQRTKFYDAPDKFIDLLLIPYDADDAEVTTPCMATIVTYEWPDRMLNIDDRIRDITRAVRHFAPGYFREDKELISFTFLGKKPGCWFAA